ncbi:hypothetical protein KIKIMORA_02320 [Brevundimonas phage vB_BpoS-Kikimora]|uniref:Uncharacterized protein n=1 Tax=Brevundimonas phage vB_BpoS-Kikimora TaxID=2948601 RepID=A0A9E7MRM9_9CAUD|nr:hypothetical protein KIKIMORA_02320 [Brevundimonas phage vB_BpoS-Kikimora]
MRKPAPPIDMEALVRRKSNKAATPTPSTDMEALVRRPAKPIRPLPESKPATPAPDLAALVKRPNPKPEATPTPSTDMEALVNLRNLERVRIENSLSGYFGTSAGQAATPAPCMASLIKRPEPTPILTVDQKRTRRAADLTARAARTEPSLAQTMRFSSRLYRFLDLTPTAWTTWGDEVASLVVKGAAEQAEAARQLSLANAIKWATECEQAYAKPPGFFDRFSQAAKPEFYQTRLEQARDALVKVQALLIELVDTTTDQIERLRIDFLVLQVATEDETDSSLLITAQRRMQTLTQVQTTAAMIKQGAETLAQTCASQAASVSSLLSVTIPNWIMAETKR